MEITLSSPLCNNKVVISGSNCEVDSQSVTNVDNVSVVMQSGGATGPAGKDGLGADPVFIATTEQRLVDLEERTPDLNYVHDQSSASSVWNINHNLQKFGSIKTIDTANTEVKGDEEYLDENNIRITFAYAIMGKAFIN